MTYYVAWIGDILVGEGHTKEEAITTAVAEAVEQNAFPDMWPTVSAFVNDLDIGEIEDESNIY